MSITSYINNPIFITDILLYITDFCTEEDKIRLCISNREISNIIKNSKQCPLFYRLNKDLLIDLSNASISLTFLNKMSDEYKSVFSNKDINTLINKNNSHIYQNKIDEYLYEFCPCDKTDDNQCLCYGKYCTYCGLISMIYKYCDTKCNCICFNKYDIYCAEKDCKEIMDNINKNRYL
jgi:hypothetical protein